MLLLLKVMIKLLVYPFLGADRFELAAKELRLCDLNSSFNVDRLITLQLEDSVGKTKLLHVMIGIEIV